MFGRKEVPERTILQLLVRAAGRCEFLGCNKFLMEEPLTLHKVRVGHVAHIAAAEAGGPRGTDELPMAERNELGNLMLLCLEHHAVVDDKALEGQYPSALLRSFKAQHEDLISRLTDYRPENRTTIVRLRCTIGGDTVAVPESAYRQAISPQYPADATGIEINLTALPSLDSPDYWSVGAKVIAQATAPLWEAGTEKPAVQHVSVFALGPIPLLVQLGTCLTSKVPATLYQRHRDDESWAWKSSGEFARYEIRKVADGHGSGAVGLILSLSGTIDLGRLPDNIVQQLPIYEIRLASAEPNPMFLRQLADLGRFVETYHRALGRIRADHPSCGRIHLFPAIPAPVAVACGRELLPKAHPSLMVYDFDKKHGVFREALEVNQ